MPHGTPSQAYGTLRYRSRSQTTEVIRRQKSDVRTVHPLCFQLLLKPWSIFEIS